MTTNYQVNGSNFESYFIRRDLLSQGNLWNWGYGTFGNLGDNTTNNQSSPIQTIAAGSNWRQISAGGNFNMGLKTDGTLWLWGQGDYGSLGNNSTTTVNNYPVQTVAAGTNWFQISGGAWHAGGIKTDGSLWMWGRNQVGNVGDNTSDQKNSPVQTVSGGNNWKLLACGTYHTAAIKTDGTLWMWGKNTQGQLGTNNATPQSSPVQTISAGTNWKQVAAGESTIAIKTDGTLWNWGLNSQGQLGDNSRTNRSSPVQTVASGTNWQLASVSQFMSAAIKTDGTLWVWGRGANGQLGDNTNQPKSSPIQTISGGTNWKLVSAGRYHTGAIKTDGTLWLWGSNALGTLGTNNTTTRSSPVQTISAGTNWKSVSVSGLNSVAITDIF